MEMEMEMEMEIMKMGDGGMEMELVTGSATECDTFDLIKRQTTGILLVAKLRLDGDIGTFAHGDDVKLPTPPSIFPFSA